MNRFPIKLLILAFLLSPLSLSAKSQYLRQIPLFWANLYPDGGTTLYCGKAFKPYDSRVNIEHVFPMAWVVSQYRCGDRKQCRKTQRRFNLIESDMHNLFPARADINKIRASHGFAMIKGEKHIRSGCDFEFSNKTRRVEPRAEVRGDIARAMLYMADRYDLKLFNKQRKTLKRWHREDPPDAAEKKRNRVIKRLQGNANLLISNP